MAKIKQVVKAHLSIHSFNYENLLRDGFQTGVVRVGWKYVTVAYIDDKRHFFLETRDVCGRLETSETFTSMTKLKKRI